MNLIIDANNMAHRARHVFNLSHEGMDVSVTYGVMRMLMAMVKRFRPTSIIMCWDGGTPHYRKQLVPEYKAHRKSRDDDAEWPIFLQQLDDLMAILPCAGVLQVQRRGIEADDLIYHASRMIAGESVVVSGDDDLLQCVDEKTIVAKPGKKGYTIVDIDNFEEVVGVSLYQYVAYKTLQGDSSDGVPGVRGIGPRTAAKLLASADIMVNAGPSLRPKLTTFIRSGAYTNGYTVMDLSSDLAGARLTLLDAVQDWHRTNVPRLRRWCINRAFTSIIEAGSLAMFGGMECPDLSCLDLGLRAPLIWSYRREPVE